MALKQRFARPTAEACAFYPSTALRAVPLPIACGDREDKPMEFQ
jgi:hypothetical protein